MEKVLFKKLMWPDGSHGVPMENINCFQYLYLGYLSNEPYIVCISIFHTFTKYFFTFQKYDTIREYYPFCIKNVIQVSEESCGNEYICLKEILENFNIIFPSFEFE